MTSEYQNVKTILITISDIITEHQKVVGENEAVEGILTKISNQRLYK